MPNTIRRNITQGAIVILRTTLSQRNKLRLHLDRIYRKYNKRSFVIPDPLQFLYSYPRTEDREIVGLIASSLAYGRVAQILKSVTIVLNILGPSPRSFLDDVRDGILLRRLNQFRHRFSNGNDITALLASIKRINREFGSLKECFAAGYARSHSNVIPALQAFANQFGSNRGYLIPDPARGSACKRLNLFLRWMVRHDAVDPGGWPDISRSKLIIPLDVHMARISREIGLSARKSADLQMAIQVTEAFKKVCPRDPVKYDFSLTRFGIHPALSSNANGSNRQYADIE